jgi:hypothetical protein
MSKHKDNKQARFQAMADSRIEPLHTQAVEYYAVMRERMKLTEREVELKGAVIELYRKSGKGVDGYHCEGVDIEWIPGKPADPTIKVKVERAELLDRTRPSDVTVSIEQLEPGPPADPDGAVSPFDHAEFVLEASQPDSAAGPEN